MPPRGFSFCLVTSVLVSPKSGGHITVLLTSTRITASFKFVLTDVNGYERPRFGRFAELLGNRRYSTHTTDKTPVRRLPRGQRVGQNGSSPPTDSRGSKRYYQKPNTACHHLRSPLLVGGLCGRRIASRRGRRRCLHRRDPDLVLGTTDTANYREHD